MNDLPIHLKIQQTEDGSPTLEMQRESDMRERMHHSGGALSESFFIYYPAIEDLRARHWKPRVLSLGLGLAYNELIAVGALHKLKDWKVISFEAEGYLRESFAAWLMDQPVVLAPVYTQVLNLVAERLRLTAATLKRHAREALDNGQLELKGRFPESAENLEPCSCILYDAFKMDADLWIENELVARLNPILMPQCLFVTYAATGALKRALKTLGFRLIAKVGFSGRRESTLAIRE